MKKIIRGIVLVLCSVFLFSCASREKKAEALVKAHLNTVLNDFSSYEPVSTKVDTLYDIPPFNPAIIEKAIELIASEKQRDKYREEANDAYEEASLWASSFSSYGTSKFENAQAKHLELSISMVKEILKEEKLEKEIVELSQGMDYTKQIGWMITHQFRSNNTMGAPILQDCLCMADLDLKTVTAFYTQNDSDAQEAMMRVTEIMKSPLSLEEYDNKIRKSEEYLESFKSKRK